MKENADDNRVQVAFKVDEVTRQRLKVKAAKAGQDQQEVLSRLATAYVDGKPEAEAIAAADDSLLDSANAQRIDELRRAASDRNVPFYDALSHAISLWLTYHQPGTTTISIAEFQKALFAMLQEQVRTPADVDQYIKLMQWVAEMTGVSKRPESPDKSNSTNAISG